MGGGGGGRRGWGSVDPIPNFLFQVWPSRRDVGVMVAMEMVVIVVSVWRSVVVIAVILRMVRAFGALVLAFLYFGSA